MSAHDPFSDIFQRFEQGTQKEKVAMAKKSKETVDEFMAKLDHPFKAEVQVIRDMIKGVNPGITEQVKWNAPSFSYKDYIATFSLHITDRLLLIFHNPAIASIQSDILEGDYPDRRLVYFADMNDIQAKQPALEYVVRELIRRMDE
jgi:hypothetical protein